MKILWILLFCSVASVASAQLVQQPAVAFCLESCTAPERDENPFLPALPCVLTMDEAVQHAMTYRPALQASCYQIQASWDAARSLWAGYLPRISGYADVHYSKGAGDPSTVMQVFLRQLLYSGAGPLEKYAIAKHEARAVEWVHEGLRNMIRNEVELAFLQAWLTDKQYESVVAVFRAADVQFDKAKNAFQLQLDNRNDWLKQVAGYAATVAQTRSYTDEQAIARKRLELFMGDEVLARGMLAWSPQQKALGSFEQWYALALEHRPELCQEKSLIAALQAKQRLTAGAQLPVVDLYATAGHAKEPRVARSEVGQTFYNAGFVVNWALFDAQSLYANRQAKAEEWRQILNLQQLTDQVKRESFEAYHECAKALSQIEAQRMDYLRAKNEIALRTQEREIGQLSDVDYQAAKALWQQSQFAWFKANIDAEIKYRTLLFTCGYPPASGDRSA